MEQARIPKDPGSDGEDRLVLVDDRLSGVAVAAVVDGATDKADRTFAGMTAGAVAAECVAAAIQKVPVGVSPRGAVAASTAALERLRHEWGIDPRDVTAPNAVAAVVVPQQQLIWRVGDVHIAVRRRQGWEHHRATKLIDNIVAAGRAALLRCRLADGSTVDQLADADAGRQMMMPLLRAQNCLANIDDDNPLGFGVLDGRLVPDRYIEVFPVDDEVVEIVLASDGYLGAAPTLRDAERRLAASLADDPLRIGEHAATKAAQPGAVSFDDRTYLRLQREGRTSA